VSDQTNMRHAQLQYIVKAWLAADSFGRGPLDRMPEWWWRNQFDQAGQFEAEHWTAGEGLMGYANTIIRPAESALTPRVRLYRLAAPQHANRWSWSDKLDVLHAAAAEDQIHRPGATLWTCIPRRVYGVIHTSTNSASDEPWYHFDEWVIEPDKVTPWDETDAGKS
jgi:hypothetical protein